MATTTTTTKYNPNDGLRPMTDDICPTCRRWVSGMAPGGVTTPDAFCACKQAVGCTHKELEGLKAVVDDAETAPSIPERVTAVQARLQALLDDVKIMGIQLGAWERAITAAAVPRPLSPAEAFVVNAAEAAVTATIEKLEKGTY